MGQNSVKTFNRLFSTTLVPPYEAAVTEKKCSSLLDLARL